MSHAARVLPWLWRNVWWEGWQIARRIVDLWLTALAEFLLLTGPQLRYAVTKKKCSSGRFTGQLTPSDPLQTIFQLLSGRVPAVATVKQPEHKHTWFNKERVLIVMFSSQCCGSEKWGDWRPHLAVMLSNETGDPVVQQRAIVTMGDTLGTSAFTDWLAVCIVVYASWLFSVVQLPKASYTPHMCATWQPALPSGCSRRSQTGWCFSAAATGELRELPDTNYLFDCRACCQYFDGDTRQELNVLQCFFISGNPSNTLPLILPSSAPSCTSTARHLGAKAFQYRPFR